MKITKERIAPYFMKISEMRDQLEELWEVMSDREMTIVVLNALPKEWVNFTSSIYAKKEASTLSEMWSLCRTEETRLKEKEDVRSKEKSFATMAKRKGKFGKLGPPKKNNKDMSKIQCFRCQEYGHYKINCPKIKKDNNNRMKREEYHLSRGERRKDSKEGRSFGSLL